MEFFAQGSRPLLQGRLADSCLAGLHLPILRGGGLLLPAGPPAGLLPPPSFPHHPLELVHQLLCSGLVPSHGHRKQPKQSKVP